MSPADQPDSVQQNRESATDRAIESVVALIDDGSFPATTRLPQESHLATQVGVSRGSLREAIRVLDYLGIVDVRVGDGTYVTELDGASLLGGLDLLGRVASTETVSEIFEIRRVLESAAAAMAATRITPEQLVELEEVLNELREETNGERFVQLDIRFHDLIAAATGNVSLRKLCESFSAKTQRARFLRSQNETDILRRSNVEHDDLFRHIKAHEPMQAAAASTTHISNVEHWLGQVMTTIADEASGKSELPDT